MSFGGFNIHFWKNLAKTLLLSFSVDHWRCPPSGTTFLQHPLPFSVFFWRNFAPPPHDFPCDQKMVVIRNFRIPDPPFSTPKECNFPKCNGERTQRGYFSFSSLISPKNNELVKNGRWAGNEKKILHLDDNNFDLLQTPSTFLPPQADPLPLACPCHKKSLFANVFGPGQWFYITDVDQNRSNWFLGIFVGSQKPFFVTLVGRVNEERCSASWRGKD